jgi:hypothetical protein
VAPAPGQHGPCRRVELVEGWSCVPAGHTAGIGTRARFEGAPNISTATAGTMAGSVPAPCRRSGARTTTPELPILATADSTQPWLDPRRIHRAVRSSAVRPCEAPPRAGVAPGARSRQSERRHSQLRQGLCRSIMDVRCAQRPGNCRCPSYPNFQTGHRSTSGLSWTTATLARALVTATYSEQAGVSSRGVSFTGPRGRFQPPTTPRFAHRPSMLRWP